MRHIVPLGAWTGLKSAANARSSGEIYDKWRGFYVGLSQMDIVYLCI